MRIKEGNEWKAVFTTPEDVIRRECGQTLGRVRVRTVVIISLQRTKG